MENNPFNLHLNPNLFTACLAFSSAKIGFRDELIEKDYFCSAVLYHLSNQPINSLIFKGETLLAKSYAGSYRLSEDLDFTLPTNTDATRKQRSSMIQPIKPIIHMY